MPTLNSFLFLPLSLVIVVTTAACFGGQPAAPANDAANKGEPEAATPIAVENGSLPSLREVVSKVSPAVVSVDVNITALDFFLRPVEQHSAGSGVIIRPDGYIITNDHVIASANSIQVALADDRVFPARVVGRDSRSDIAVLKIDADGLPSLEFAEKSSARVGDWVVAFGNALGLEGTPTVTVGIISALGRTVRTSSGTTLTDLIQTDAAINEGNSGGPLVNLNGELVGINTTILAEARGIGFSINSDTVQRFTTDLIEVGRIRRPLIGIFGRTLNPAIAQQLGLKAGNGVLVTAVGEGPAKRAGILTRDVILKFDGRGVSSWDQFLGILWSHRPGDQVGIEIARGEERHSLTVTLDEAPADGS
ncbi:MAG: trypsin-like peptidase domain-containing protein [Chloroflexi bacterium]|nr:trypsin-like peptidase domain-containing protein [Chloroflexota bacterium]